MQGEQLTPAGTPSGAWNVKSAGWRPPLPSRGDLWEVSTGMPGWEEGAGGREPAQTCSPPTAHPTFSLPPHQT